MKKLCYRVFLYIPIPEEYKDYPAPADFLIGAFSCYKLAEEFCELYNKLHSGHQDIYILDIRSGKKNIICGTSSEVARNV